MAYPEPIPELTGKQALEFLKRLGEFRLSGSQRELYREAFAAFAAMNSEKSE